MAVLLPESVVAIANLVRKSGSLTVFSALGVAAFVVAEVEQLILDLHSAIDRYLP